jgi:hypothetical protein
VKKAEREEEDATKHVTEWSDAVSTVKRVLKRVRKITEWFWAFKCSWSIVAYCGAAAGKDCVELLAHVAKAELVTTSDDAPRPDHVLCPELAVNITWLAQRWDATDAFAVDRSAASCHTPRRNEPIQTALDNAVRLCAWAASVQAYLENMYTSLDAAHQLKELKTLDLSALSGAGVFVPVTPLLLAADDDAAAKRALLLPAAERAAFAAEQKRSVDAKVAALKKAFGATASQLVTVAEATAIVTAQLTQALAQRFVDCVNYVEFLLEQQLVAAVGKVVQPKDFAEYMQFHARRLFKAEFAPKPFVYAIRRPDHCPEGELTIDADVGGGALAQPLHTLVASSAAKQPWFFALGAASRCAFYGARHLHGGVLHKFANEADCTLTLTARARQFSSFILLVGKIASADTFEPTHAMIVQNKDDVIVPLQLETIPSAKAFKEAIESMSPEQQRFAKMFRAMQLESTLFAVCIVQIKPQLEKLLNLPYDALTKELQLTQDLMDIFIQYQVPSDLLAYDGKASAAVDEKIAAVKAQVQSVRDMIDRAKNTQLETVQEEANFAIAVDETRYKEMSSSEYEDDCDEEEECCNDADDYGSMQKMSAGLYDMEREEMPRMAMAEMAEESVMRAPTRERMVLAAAPKAAAKISEPPAPKKPEVDKKPEPAKKADDKKPEQKKPDGAADGDDAANDNDGDEPAAEAVDFTKVPSLLDERFGTLTNDGAVCATKISVANEWRRKFQRSLLAKQQEETLDADGLATHKNKCFDLLDSLTKSGGLAIELAELHCVILSTHCFVKSALHTITRDNINPIEKVEATQLIVAAALHGCSARALVREAQLERVATYSPNLFEKERSGDSSSKKQKKKKTKSSDK